MVKVALLYAAGTNCDAEMAQAFVLAGSRVAYLHINEVKQQPSLLRRYQILGIPGGFTYGDYIAAGVVLANELRFSLRDEIVRFIDSGKLILGVCNGFQVLVKSGILPGTKGYFSTPTATLAVNDSQRFECRWVHLQPESGRCVFLSGIERTIYMPVAHAEGKFVADSKKTLQALVYADQVAVTYAPPPEPNQDGVQGSACGTCRTMSIGRPTSANGPKPAAVACDQGTRSFPRAVRSLKQAAGDAPPEVTTVEYPWNPNGSQLDIAGICDPTGRVFGLMPHPERFVRWTQHPNWTRLRGPGSGGQGSGEAEVPDGLLIYQNGVRYAKQNL